MTRLVGAPLELANLDGGGRSPMWHWRTESGRTAKHAAAVFGVSIATYYRYEEGQPLSIRKANLIVAATRGRVRYRDLIANFKPEYA